MFFKVVALTLVLLVQITDQGKQLSKRHPLFFYNESIDRFGHNTIRNARRFKSMHKWFVKNGKIDTKKIPHQKSRFFDVMNSIAKTPDYGLKFTEEKQLEFDIPGFPGFHNLIEVRGPIPNRYIPNRLNEYKMKSTTQSLESRELRKIFNQLNEVSFSKEGFSIWDNSHESYKRSPGSVLVSNVKPTTPMLKFHERHQYNTKVFTTTTVTAVAKVTSNLNVVSFVAPVLFEKIDPLPYKQVKARDQDPDSDEDEDDVRYYEYY